MTTAQLLKSVSNDYSVVSIRYKKLTGKNMLSYKPLGSKFGFQIPISVVIPTFNSANTLLRTLYSLNAQILSQKERAFTEIIVVDDGSSDNTAKLISKFDSLLPLRYVRQSNAGRSQARNRGVVFAHGTVIVFINSDVILEQHFIREHALRHKTFEKLVLISFQENIHESDSRISIDLIKKGVARPKITKDFRFERDLAKEWLKPHRPLKNVEVRKVRLLDETNNFKTFGNDRVVGVWDLPSMFIPNAVSVKASGFEAVKGFNLRFHGWGMEDTFLAASLICRGNYIIPVFSTGVYHVEHKPRSGSLRALIQEYNKNVRTYQDLANQPIEISLQNLTAVNE